MSKKITAIFLLTFASFIMLAFAVLPHHHHQEFICFNNLHCENSASEAQHTHDDNPFCDSEGCVKHLFQTQISRQQSLVHHCDNGFCFHFIQSLFFVRDMFSFLSLETKSLNFSPEYYQEKLHSACYISDLSGRAPPHNS